MTDPVISNWPVIGGRRVVKAEAQPLTRQERAVTAVSRGRADRPPVQLEFSR